MISVDRLVAIPSLGLTYVAGEVGKDRLVTWAHACDLQDPWHWFEVGDLVMTTGAGLPAGEAEQVEWMNRLIDSRVAALVIAPRPKAARPTPAMLAVADERGFPVLSASFGLKFVTLARTVIESAVESERQRLATMNRLNETYWRSLHDGGTFAARLSALEVATGWALDVRDRATGTAVARGELARTLEETDAGTGDSPVEFAIPGTSELALAARPVRKPVGDRFILEHVGGLIALELEHEATQRDRLRASGQDLLSGLLDETLSISAVWPELRHRGMTGPVVVAYWRAVESAPLDHTKIHHLVRLQPYAPLLLPSGESLLGVVPHDADLLVEMSRRLSPQCAVGVSSPLTMNSSIPEAARQARLAVAAAHEQRRVLSVYGEDGSDLDLLPRSVEDIRRLARKVLGPLVEHDRRNQGDLLRSVRTFLANDRQWQRTADELGVHRQTLVYRLRRVEDLTGYKPGSTAGSATLWLALSAVDRADLTLDELVDRPAEPTPP